MRERKRSGSIALDERINTWHFFWWEDGKRHSKRIGTASEYPTKASAWKAATTLRHTLEKTTRTSKPTPAPLVSVLIEQYRAEKMPERFSTRRGYNAWLKNHIAPKWGKCEITELQPRPVELWLRSLTLAPKSKANMRGVLRILWKFAMWRGDVPAQKNPMELVTVKDSSKRTRQPRSLTVAEFQQFIVHLREPFRTMALVCVCLGLRISECLALRWSDVDWLNGKLRIERGIVRQNVDDVKTTGSRKQLSASSDVLEVLKTWKQMTQFSANEDWIFASPAKLGRLPWSYPLILRLFHKAGTDAGIGTVSPHALRHSYRSWLDAVGTPVAVQQKLMRHASITTTMNIYGDVVTDEMAVASGKVAGLILGNGM